jgi:hypothetical protein
LYIFFLFWLACLASRFLCQAAATAYWEATTGLQANVFLINSYLYLSFWAVAAAIFGQKHACETYPFSKVSCCLIHPFPKGTCFWLHPFSKVFCLWIPFFKGICLVKPFLKGVVLPPHFAFLKKALTAFEKEAYRDRPWSETQL